MQVTEEALASRLSTSWLGKHQSVDLLLRTSEHRVSDFLLWEMGYAELVFSECLWPDFSEQHFRDAVTSYSQRHRRYGRREMGAGVQRQLP